MSKLAGPAQDYQLDFSSFQREKACDVLPLGGLFPQTEVRPLFPHLSGGLIKRGQMHTTTGPTGALYRTSFSGIWWDRSAPACFPTCLFDKVLQKFNLLIKFAILFQNIQL